MMRHVHKNDRQSDSYDELFITFSDSVERQLIRIGKWLLVLFIVSQLLLQFPAVRRVITAVDVLEGVPVQADDEP